VVCVCVCASVEGCSAWEDEEVDCLLWSGRSSLSAESLLVIDRGDFE
jgi:hypothetical protein